MLNNPFSGESSLSAEIQWLIQDFHEGEKKIGQN